MENSSTNIITMAVASILLQTPLKTNPHHHSVPSMVPETKVFNTHVLKINKCLRKLQQDICINLEGWNGEGVWREV